MTDKRKFSLFLSSTYEDLKEERQSLLGVALENGFIPVGMEQFHGMPTDQWSVITKVIDECDFYLLVIGGRYGSIDASTNLSYTEKEYNYAKSKGIRILVLIKKPSSITDDKKDNGEDKYEKMRRLDAFRERVQNDGITADYFENLQELKYVATQTLRNAREYADETDGWVRYSDVTEVINEEAESRFKVYSHMTEEHQGLLEEIKSMLDIVGNKISGIESDHQNWGRMPTATQSDIDKLFRVEGETLIIGDGNAPCNNTSEENPGNIPIDSIILLVYASEGNAQILKTQTLSLPTEVSIPGKRFMADDSQRESARWVEALERLVNLGLVRALGYKNEIFVLTSKGYDTADHLKSSMNIDTSKTPLEELQRLNS